MISFQRNLIQVKTTFQYAEKDVLTVEGKINDMHNSYQSKGFREESLQELDSVEKERAQLL